jgi:23S rRNA pseudoU1915 N3-methylase RlmH
MVRLFFMEQLYRAYTITKGEKYHHIWKTIWLSVI